MAVEVILYLISTSLKFIAFILLWAKVEKLNRKIAALEGKLSNKK